MPFQLNCTRVGGALPELRASITSLVPGGIVKVCAPLLQLVAAPAISHLRLIDALARESRKKVRLALPPGATSTWTLKSLATIGAAGES